MLRLHYSVGILVVAFVAFQVIGQEQCPPVSCPPDDGSGNPIFLPDKTNCSRYYICAPFAICRECPRPLVWDPTINSCNQPGAYPCEATTTTGAPPTEPPTERTTTDEGVETTTEVDMETTTVDGEETTTEFLEETTTEFVEVTTEDGEETTTSNSNEN